MNCLICGSDNITSTDTIVSDFVMARIAPNEKENYKTKLCFCKECSFAFYEYRINSEEEQALYKNYRDSEYQKTREKSECWYTEKINNLLNNDSTSINEQKRVIRKILNDNGVMNIKSALDYGGNEGKTFFDEIGTENKYVFDISGVPTLKGVENISDFSKLSDYRFDFIMCNMLFEHLADPMSLMGTLKDIGDENTIYYIEVPSENPFVSGNKHSIANNLKLVFNPHFSFFKLVKYYFKKRKDPFMTMHEHINFYTADSMKRMIDLSGFTCIDIQENEEDTAIGRQTVLSALFKKAVGM